jgi:hypothetical protein
MIVSQLNVVEGEQIHHFVLAVQAALADRKGRVPAVAAHSSLHIATGFVAVEYMVVLSGEYNSFFLVCGLDVNCRSADGRDARFEYRRDL